MEKYTTEYLITHEDSLNWDELSSDPDDMFSLIEIRLFRSKINWKLYFKSHIKNLLMTTEMFEIASKYFSESVYKILSGFNIATEEFILNHPDKFDFELLIENYPLSEEFLLSTINFWNKEDIKHVFKKSKCIDIENPKYSSIKLLLETHD